jgi:DNA polymerase III delta prime subunit
VIVIHPTSAQATERIIHRQPHASLLSGVRGVGLRTIAMYIAESLQSTPLIIDQDEKGIINIESIRTLYRQTSGKKTKAQVVIIDDAEKMSLGAQQAFLKLLEEPTQNTVFVLTSHQPQQLLGTILSRLQHIEILPITEHQTMTLISRMANVSPEKQRQLLYIGLGKPAELSRAVHDEAYFAMKAEEIRQAKQFVDSTTYEKLKIVHSVSSDRTKSTALLEHAATIVRLAIQRQPSTTKHHKLLLALIKAREKLNEDGNSKVQLMRAVFLV